MLTPDCGPALIFAGTRPAGFTHLKLINVQPKDTLELSVVQRCLPRQSAAGLGRGREGRGLLLGSVNDRIRGFSCGDTLRMNHTSSMGMQRRARPLNSADSDSSCLLDTAVHTGSQLGG